MFKAIFKPKGGRSMEDRIKALTDEAQKEIKEAVSLSIMAIHKDIVDSVRDNSSGTTATRYQPKREVKVSEPGDAPNSDTGQLMKSIKFSFDESTLEGRVSALAPYATALEFGTTEMAERPFFRPAIEKNRAKVQKAVRAALKHGIKAAKGGK